MASGDTDALRKYVMDEMAYGACTGETLYAWPETIEVDEPVTNDDVREVFTGRAFRFYEPCMTTRP
jgi:hypothetical protein